MRITRSSYRPGLRIVALALLGAPIAAQSVKLNEPLPRPAGQVWGVQGTPDGGRVLYVAEQDVYGVRELYSVPVDGGAGSVQLNVPLGPYQRPGSQQFTPDGSRVVFVIDPDALFSGPPDGSAPAAQIASIHCEGCDDSYFEYRITPDGGHVLYRDNEPVAPGIWQYPLFGVPVDGSRPTVRLSELDMYSVSSYAASPDGEHVAFTASKAVDGLHLYGRPIDAGAPAVRLDADLTPVLDSLAIAPDRTVLFGATAADGVVRLFGAPVDGSAPPFEVSGPLVTGGGVGGFGPLPDGAHVVYTADALEAGRVELFRAPVDGSGPALRLNHALAASGSVTGYEIAPDGARVVYWARENGIQQIYSVRSDRSRRPVRLNGALVAGGEVRRGWPLDSDGVISPDGRRAVYVADQRVDGVDELFSVPIDATERPKLRRSGEPRVVRLNGELPAGHAGIRWFRIAADSTRVMYRVDSTTSYCDVYGVPIGGGPALLLNDEPASASWRSAPLLVGTHGVFAYGTALHAVPLDRSSPPVRLNPPTALGAPVGDVHDFATSPDERWTVYVADQEEDQRYELFGVRTRGGEPPRKLSSDGESMSAFWPPDGTFRITPDASRVVYLHQTTTSGADQLSVAPIDGSYPALRLQSGIDVQPRFVVTSDGERVVFLRGSSAATRRLFSQRLDGSQAPVALDGTLVAGGGVDAFAVSSDATHVVFRADAEVNDRLDLYTVAIDGGTPRARLNPAWTTAGDVGEFALTADSSRVVFLADARLAGQQELYAAPIDASQPALELDPLLLGTRDVLRFVLAPDASSAVFVSDVLGTQRLHAVPLDASTPPVQLNAALVAGGDVSSAPDAFLVSPDARRVVYLADQDVDDRMELYGVPLDGSRAAVKLNGLLDAGGQVLDADGRPAVRITPDSRTVVFLAREGTFGTPVELFRAGIAGVGAPVRASGPLASPATIRSFQLDPFGLQAFYLLDDGSSTHLLRVPMDGAHSPRRIDEADSSVSRAELSPRGRFVLYLQPLEGDAFELFSHRLPVHPRPSAPPTGDATASL
jgi:Tol biopolymer transport system component